MRIVKKILIVLGWLSLMSAIGFSVYFAYTKMMAVRCQSIVVNINPSSPRFIDEEEIIQMIQKSGVPSIGDKLCMINIGKLEQKLSSFTTLDNVEIYRKIEAKGFSFSGKLIVHLDERTPVLRIKNKREDYYLDRQGVKIPVSAKYLDRILIANGPVPEEPMRSSLLMMADYINKDEFWRAQIEQILIQENNEILMLPQVGNYLIQFGLPDDYKLKFRNLKAVYQQGFKNFGWNKYQLISVKYQNQVVCTKK